MLANHDRLYIDCKYIEFISSYKKKCVKTRGVIIKVYSLLALTVRSFRHEVPNRRHYLPKRQ